MISLRFNNPQIIAANVCRDSLTIHSRSPLNNNRNVCYERSGLSLLQEPLFIFNPVFQHQARNPRKFPRIVHRHGAGGNRMPDNHRVVRPDRRPGEAQRDADVQYIRFVHRLNRPSSVTTSPRSTIKSGSAFTNSKHKPRAGRDAG